MSQSSESLFMELFISSLSSYRNLRERLYRYLVTDLSTDAVSIQAAMQISSFRIMENNSCCKSLTTSQEAHAMPHYDTIVTLCSLNRSIVYAENNCITL